MTTFLRSREVEYPHYGQRSYHIEIRQDGPIAHQRHVWTREDGWVEVDEWIPTGHFRRDTYQECAESALSAAA